MYCEVDKIKGFPPGRVNWYNLFSEQFGDTSQKPPELSLLTQPFLF